MNHLLAPFIWIDALIQRGVDATAFFLMRRGVPKSLIIYGFGAVVVMGILSIIYRHLKEGNMGMAIIFIVAALIIFANFHLGRKEDEADEEKGVMLTRSDHRRKGGIWKILWMGFFIKDILSVFVTSMSWSLFISLSFDISFLIIIYLAKTPNTPPAQKKTVLVPVKESA